jgi:hypothetical protein
MELSAGWREIPIALIPIGARRSSPFDQGIGIGRDASFQDLAFFVVQTLRQLRAETDDLLINFRLQALALRGRSRFIPQERAFVKYESAANRPGEPHHSAFHRLNKE